MGCDIHAYVEYERTAYDGKRWSSFGERINPGRNYRLFARLAGVRGDASPVVEPRGYPEDAGWSARDDWWLCIDPTATDSGECTTPERAAYYAEAYGRRIRRNPQGQAVAVEQPDWHTPSWLTTAEFAEAIDGAEYAEEYHAILAAMRSFEAQGYPARVVFWFDN